MSKESTGSTKKVNLTYQRSPFLEDRSPIFLFEVVESDVPEEETAHDCEDISDTLPVKLFHKDDREGYLNCRTGHWFAVELDLMTNQRLLRDYVNPLRVAGVYTPDHDFAEQVTELFREKGYGVIRN